MNWNHLKTILWLRWRLTRNQWMRSGGLGAVIAVIVAVAVFLLGGASFVAALLVGILSLDQAKPVVIMGIWLGATVIFLFVWLLGLINEIQRSESIDLQRLMHLPVALGQMFVVNYVASHLTFSVVLLVPAMMGLAIGMVISRGPSMLLLIPLALGMVFMISAWTYCLRGWLAAMMSNPRRRRTVIMLITVGFILIAQLPNVYFNVIRRFDRPKASGTPAEVQRQHKARGSETEAKLNQFLVAQKFIPPLWLPVGAKALAEGRRLPACLGVVGCFAIGALGLRRAYRSTLRFYYGESGGKAMAMVSAEHVSSTDATPDKAGTRLVELRLPGVPEQAAAVALATFRSMLRAPEVKLAWGTSFVVTFIVGGSLLFRAAPKMHDVVKPFIATGAVSFSIFMLVQFLANQFGFDRDGFRALILSPMDRRLILLGKNLACLPVIAGFGLMLLAFIAVWLHLGVFALMAAVFQLVALLLLASLFGNVISILVPYRIQAGSMKPTKMPGLAMAVMMACHLSFPIALAPAFLPPLGELLWHMAGWKNAVAVNLLLSAGLAVVTGIGYWQTLGPLGRLLQRRETKILGVITVEVE